MDHLKLASVQVPSLHLSQLADNTCAKVKEQVISVQWLCVDECGYYIHHWSLYEINTLHILLLMCSIINTALSWSL